MHAHPFGSASADRQVERERGREREMRVCVFFLNFVIFLPTYFKVSRRSLQKILIVRDVFE